MQRKNPPNILTDKQQYMDINTNKTRFGRSFVDVNEILKMQNSTDPLVKILRDSSNCSISGIAQKSDVYRSGINVQINSNENYTRVKTDGKYSKPNLIGKTLREKQVKSGIENRLKFEKKSNHKYTHLNKCIKTDYKQTNVVTKSCPGDDNVPQVPLLSQSNKPIGTRGIYHFSGDFDNANDSNNEHLVRALELRVTCRENELHRQTFVTQSQWEGGSVKVKQTDVLRIQEDSTSVRENVGVSVRRNGIECLHLVHVVGDGYPNDKWNVYNDNKHTSEGQTLVTWRSDIDDQKVCINRKESSFRSTACGGIGFQENNTREVEKSKHISPYVVHYSGENVDHKYSERYVNVSNVSARCSERNLNKTRHANGQGDYLPKKTKHRDIRTRYRRDNWTKSVPAPRTGITDQKIKNNESKFEQVIPSCSDVCGSVVKEKHTSPTVIVQHETDRNALFPSLGDIYGQENLAILKCNKKSDDGYQNKALSSRGSEIVSFCDCNKKRDIYSVTDENTSDDPGEPSQEYSDLKVSYRNLILTCHLCRRGITKHREEKTVAQTTGTNGGTSVRQLHAIENGVVVSNSIPSVRKVHEMDVNATVNRQDGISKEHKICKASRSQALTTKPSKVTQISRVHVIPESKNKLTSKTVGTVDVAKTICREAQKHISVTLGRNHHKSNINNPKIKETVDFSLTRAKKNWKYLADGSRNVNIGPQNRKCTTKTIQEKKINDSSILQEKIETNVANNNVFQSTSKESENILDDAPATKNNIHINTVQQFDNGKPFVAEECDIVHQCSESDTAVIISPSCLNINSGIPATCSSEQLPESTNIKKNVSALDLARSQSVNKSAICVVTNKSSASDVSESPRLRKMIDSNILTDVNQNVDYSTNCFSRNSLDSNASEEPVQMEVSIKTHGQNFPFISSSTDDQSPNNNQSLVCSVGRVTECPDNCQSFSSAFVAIGETAKKVILDTEGNYLPEYVSSTFSEPSQTPTQETETEGRSYENEIVLKPEKLSKDDKKSVVDTNCSNVHQGKYGSETKQKTECKAKVAKNERTVNVTKTLGPTKSESKKEPERKRHNKSEAVNSSEKLVTKTNSATVRQKWMNIADKTCLNQLKKNERDCDGKETNKFKGNVNVVGKTTGATNTKAQKNWQSLTDKTRKGLLQKVVRDDDHENESLRKKTNTNEGRTASVKEHVASGKSSIVSGLHSSNVRKQWMRLAEKTKESRDNSKKKVCTVENGNNKVLLNDEKQSDKSVTDLNSKDRSTVNLCNNTAKQKWKALASKATNNNSDKIRSSIDAHNKSMQPKNSVSTLKNGKEGNSDSVCLDIKNNNMRRSKETNSQSNTSNNFKNNTNSGIASRPAMMLPCSSQSNTDPTHKNKDVDSNKHKLKHFGRKNLSDVVNKVMIQEGIGSIESRRKTKSSLPLPTLKTGTDNHSPCSSRQSSPMRSNSGQRLSISPSPDIKADTLSHHEVFTKSRIPRPSTPKSPTMTRREMGSPYLSKPMSEKIPPTASLNKKSVLWTRAVHAIKTNVKPVQSDTFHLKSQTGAIADRTSTYVRDTSRKKMLSPVLRKHGDIQQERKSKVPTSAQDTDNCARSRFGQSLKVKSNPSKGMTSPMNNKCPVDSRSISPRLSDRKLQKPSLNSGNSVNRSQNSHIKMDKVKVPRIRVSDSSSDSKESGRHVHTGPNIANTHKSLHVPNKPTISSSAKCQSGIPKSRSPSPLKEKPQDSHDRSISPKRIGTSAKKTTKNKVTTDKSPKLSPKLRNKNVDCENSFTVEDLIIIAKNIPPKYPDKPKNKVSFKQLAKHIIQQNRKCSTTKVTTEDAKYQCNAEQFEILNRSFLELLSEQKNRDQNADSSRDEPNVTAGNEDQIHEGSQIKNINNNDAEAGEQSIEKHDENLVKLIQNEANKCSISCEFESFISEHEDSLYEKLHADSAMLVKSFNACLATEVSDCPEAKDTENQQVNCQTAKDCGMNSENKYTDNSYQQNIAHPSKSDTVESNVFVDNKDVLRQHDDNACDVAEKNILPDGNFFINMDMNDSDDSKQRCSQNGNAKLPVSDTIGVLANEGHIERPDTDTASSFSVSVPVQYMTRFQNIYDKESTKCISVCAAAGDTDLIKPSESGTEGNLYSGNSLQNVSGINDEKAVDSLASSNEELVGNRSLIAQSKGEYTDRQSGVKSEEIDSVQKYHIHLHEQNSTDSTDRTTKYRVHTDKKQDHSISKCTEEKQNMEIKERYEGVCDTHSNAKSDNGDISKTHIAISNKKNVPRRNSVFERYEKNILLSQKKTEERVTKGRGCAEFAAATKRSMAEKTATDTKLLFTGNGVLGSSCARFRSSNDSLSGDLAKKALEHISNLETEVPSPRAKSEHVIMDSNRPTNVIRTSAEAISAKESHSEKVVNLNSKCTEFGSCTRGDTKSDPGNKQINPGKTAGVTKTLQVDSRMIETVQTAQPQIVHTMMSHSTESSSDVDTSHITLQDATPSVDRPINATFSINNNCFRNTCEAYEKPVTEDKGWSVSVDIELCDWTENNTSFDRCKDSLSGTVNTSECVEETMDTSLADNQPNITSEAVVCQVSFGLSDQNSPESISSAISNTLADERQAIVKPAPADCENSPNLFSENDMSEIETESSLLVVNDQTQATVMTNICDTKTERCDAICEVQQKKPLTRGLKRFTAVVNLVQKSIAEEKAKEEQQTCGPGKKPNFKYGKISEICKVLMEKAKHSKKSNVPCTGAADIPTPTPNRKMNCLREGKSWIRVPVGLSDSDSSVNNGNANTAKKFWQRALIVRKTDPSQDVELKHETPTDPKSLYLGQKCENISDTTEQYICSQIAETPTEGQEKETNVFKILNENEITRKTDKGIDDNTQVFQIQEMESNQTLTAVITAEGNESSNTTMKTGINDKKDEYARKENMGKDIREACNDTTHDDVFEITQVHMEPTTDLNIAIDEKTDAELTENRTDVQIWDPIVENNGRYENSLRESEEHERTEVTIVKMTSNDSEDVSNESDKPRELHNYKKQLNESDQTEFGDKQLSVTADSKTEIAQVNSQNIYVVHEKMSGYTYDENTVQQNDIQVGSVELEVANQIGETLTSVALCEDSEQNYADVFQTLDVQEQFSNAKMEIQHCLCDSVYELDVRSEIINAGLIDSEENILCDAFGTQFTISENSMSIKKELEMATKLEDQSLGLTGDTAMGNSEKGVGQRDDTCQGMYGNVMGKLDGDISMSFNEISHETANTLNDVVQSDVSITNKVSTSDIVPMSLQSSGKVSTVQHNEMSPEQCNTVEDTNGRFKHQQGGSDVANLDKEIGTGNFFSATNYYISDEISFVVEPRKSKSRPISRYDIMDLFEPDSISDGPHKLRSKSEERAPHEKDIQLVPIILKGVRLDLSEECKYSTRKIVTKQYCTDSGLLSKNSCQNQEINSFHVPGKGSARKGEIGCDSYGRDGDTTATEAYQDKNIEHAPETKQDRQNEEYLEVMGTLHEVELINETGHDIVNPLTEYAKVDVVKYCYQSDNSDMHINDRITTTLSENVSNFPLLENVEQIDVKVDSTEFSLLEKCNGDNVALKWVSMKQPLDTIATRIDTHSTSLSERYIPHQTYPCHTNNIMFVGSESYEQSFMHETTDILATLPIEGVQYVNYCDQLKNEEEKFSLAVGITQYIFSTCVTQSLLCDIYEKVEPDPLKRYQNPKKLHETKYIETASNISAERVHSGVLQNSYPVENSNPTPCLYGDLNTSEELAATSGSEFIYQSSQQSIPTLVKNTVRSPKYNCKDMMADFTFDENMTGKNETDATSKEQNIPAPIRLKAVKIKENMFPKKETADEIEPITGFTEVSEIQQNDDKSEKISKDQNIPAPIRLRAVKIKEEVFPKEETADDIEPVLGFTERLSSLKITSSESKLAQELKHTTKYASEIQQNDDKSEKLLNSFEARGRHSEKRSVISHKPCDISIGGGRTTTHETNLMINGDKFISAEKRQFHADNDNRKVLNRSEQTPGVNVQARAGKVTDNTTDRWIIGGRQGPEPANSRDLNVSRDGSSMLTQGFTTWKGDICTELDIGGAMGPREKDQNVLLTEITELEQDPKGWTTNTNIINKQGQSEEACSIPSEIKPNQNEKQFRRSLSLPDNALSFDNPKVYYKDGHFCIGKNQDKITVTKKTRNGQVRKTKVETNAVNTNSPETDKQIPEVRNDSKNENVMKLFPGLADMKDTLENNGDVFADNTYSEIAFLFDEDFPDANNAPLRHVYIPRTSRSPQSWGSQSENFGGCRLPRSASVDQVISDDEQFGNSGRTRNGLEPDFPKLRRSSSFKDAIEKDPVESGVPIRRSASFREASINLYSNYKTGSQSEDTVSLSRPKSPGFFRRMITRSSFNEKNLKRTKSTESFKEIVKKMSLKGIFKKNKNETLSQKSNDEQKHPPLAAFQCDEDIHSIDPSATPYNCHANTLPRRYTSEDIFSQVFATAPTRSHSRPNWANRTISEDQMSVQSLNIQSQNRDQPQRPISPKPVGLSPSKRFSSRSIHNVYSLTKDLTSHSKTDFRQYSNKCSKVLKQNSTGEMELDTGEEVLLKEAKDITDGRHGRDPCSVSSPEKYSTLEKNEMTPSNSNDSGIQHDVCVDSSNESLKVTSDAMVTVKRRKSPSPRQERPKSEICVRWADQEDAPHVIKIKRRKGNENVKDRPRPKSDLEENIQLFDELFDEVLEDFDTGGSSLEYDGMKAFGSETILLPYSSLGNLEELRRRDAQQSNKPAKSRRMSTPHPIKSRIENSPPNQKRRNTLVRSHSMPESLDKLPKQQRHASAFGVDLHMNPFTSSADCDDSSDDSEFSVDHRLQESRSMSAHSSRLQLTTLDEMPEEENSTFAEALWDHVTMDPEELGFCAGDLIQVIYMSDKDWWWGSLEEQEGWFPAAFVRLRVNQDQFEDELSKRLESDILGSPKLRRVNMINKDQARENVVNEIINAEREYVAHIRDVVEGYIRHARRRSDMFSEERILRIFGNIEAIYHFSSKFLSRLETCIHSSAPHLSELGKCFLEQRRGFEIYSDYCNNHPSACDELKELYRNKKYKHFFEACRLLQEMIEIPLEGFLLTPVQKICKYPLQLAELLKFTPPDHPDSQKVEEALEAMKKIATLINERKRKMESIEKLAVWQQSVEDWDGSDLLDASSELIYSNEANKINSSGWSQERYFFLFDHQLIYCKKDLLKRNAFCYKGRVDLDQCEVHLLEDGKDTQYNVTVRNAWKLHETLKDKWYLLYAKSPAAKQRWLKALQDERQRVIKDQENNFNIPTHWKTNAMKKLRAQKEKQQRTNTVPINYIAKDISSHATLPRTHFHQEKKKSWFNFGRKAKR